MKKFIGFACASAVLLFAGCSKGEGDIVKIGGIAPLSGAVAVYGVECKNGIDLAIEEINAAGGINGKQVKFICEDDEGSPDKTVNAFKKLTTKDRVKIIIGSLTSGCAQSISTLSQAGKILQIAPAATAPAITEVGNYVFRACFIDPLQGTVGGKFVAENLGKKDAAVLYDVGNDYSVGLADNFKTSFAMNGGRVVSIESYATGDKDFNAQLTKIKNANPDVVYVPDYYGTVALIAKQLRAQGINVPIVGGDGWDGLTENAGDEVLNGFYSNHYAVDSTEPAVQKYVNAFREKYNKDPNSFSALGYDSVYMLRDAMVKADSTSNIAAIRDAFEATNGDYVTGHLTFDKNRNPVKSAVMLELVNGADGKLTTRYKATVEP